MFDIYIYFAVAIAWNIHQRSVLEESFVLNAYKVDLEFTFDINAEDSFPRKQGALAYADFAILNVPNNTFQAKTLSMKFDNVNFQSFAGTHSQMVSLNILSNIKIILIISVFLFRI